MSRPRWSPGCSPVASCWVVVKVAASGVGAGGSTLPPDPRAQGRRAPASLALGELAVVVGAPVAVAVPDLGDRGHVDGVAGPPVPVPGSR